MAAIIWASKMDERKPSPLQARRGCLRGDIRRTARDLLLRPPHRKRSERGRASGSEGLRKDKAGFRCCSESRISGVEARLWQDSYAQAVFASMMTRSALPRIFLAALCPPASSRRGPWKRTTRGVSTLPPRFRAPLSRSVKLRAQAVMASSRSRHRAFIPARNIRFRNRHSYSSMPRFRIVSFPSSLSRNALPGGAPSFSMTGSGERKKPQKPPAYIP